ncbi:MAG: hypothetical protein ABI430_04890 [Candidatus Taylorbacteria bacterium]
MTIFDPKPKALIASTFFFLAGLYSWIFLVSDHRAGLPLFIFYITIVVNTFFSLVLFSSIIPRENVTQKILDGLLIVCYLLLAQGMRDPASFLFFDTLLFIFATAKYAFLLGVVNHPRLLKRKILADLSGVCAGVLAFGGLVAGYSYVATWALAIVFVIANFILFFIFPLYRLDSRGHL